MTAVTQSLASQIRALSLQLVHQANASHIGSALSIADLLAVLTADNEICNMPSPHYPGRDRIILSKGHACVAYYSSLHLKGFFSREVLFTYGQDHSALMNHVSHKVPGVEFSTGALGHGLPIACGLAMAAKLSGQPWRIIVILSDGELQEGSNWEALMFAAHHKLCNITICIDNNNLQSLTSVDETLSLYPLEDKLKAFGWWAETLDGHHHDGLIEALVLSRKRDFPTALILKTVKGKGVAFMENQVAWHYKSPNESELEIALHQIGIQ